MNGQQRIEIDPSILVGKPVVKGTRLAVEFIVDLLAQGWTEAEILRNYPGLTSEDIKACLAYASARTWSGRDISQLWMIGRSGQHLCHNPACLRPQPVA